MAVPPVRLGGADGGPGALSTLEREPALAAVAVASPVDNPVDNRSADPRPADPRPGEFFVVDPDEWATGPRPESYGPPEPGPERLPSRWRRLGRVVLVVVVGLVAFHHSVDSLLHSIATGSVLVYVLAVPVHAGLAAAAASRRPDDRPGSGVRLRDVLLGAVACLAALGVTALLGPGLSGVYGLWRLDLLLLWVFLLGGTVLCFGLRQVMRSWAAWTVLLLLWPYPVRLANAALSGALGGALLLLVVVLAVAAYGHRRGDPPRRQVLGSAAAAGGLVLLLSAMSTHPQRIYWPSVTAAGVVAIWWAARTHAVPGVPGVPVAGGRVRVPAVVLVALGAVGLVALPPAPRSVAPVAPTGITDLLLGPVVVPGFATTSTTVSKAQQRNFGVTSVWQRLRVSQGDPATGPAPDGRELVVDVLSTPRPQALELYPVVTTYPMGTLSSTPDAEVDVGHGVTGQVFRATDSRHHLAYTLLTFSWRLPVDMSITGGYTGPPAQLTQRITLIAVDDHRDGAAFPEPGTASLDVLRALLASVGSEQRAGETARVRADEQLLTDTARALVERRLTGR